MSAVADFSKSASFVAILSRYRRLNSFSFVHSTTTCLLASLVSTRTSFDKFNDNASIMSSCHNNNNVRRGNMAKVTSRDYPKTF